VVEAVKRNFTCSRSDVEDVQKSADESLDASRSDQASANQSELSIDELRRLKFQVVARSEEVPIDRERDVDLVSPSDAAATEQNGDEAAR
jgi:hypothetical protein